MLTCSCAVIGLAVIAWRVRRRTSIDIEEEEAVCRRRLAAEVLRERLCIRSCDGFVLNSEKVHFTTRRGAQCIEWL